jgi:hypothetical protein
MPEARDQVDRAVEIAIRISLLALWISLCFAIMQPFLVPIAWGIIIAVAVHPGYLILLRTLGNRRGLASVIFTLTAILVLILPILLLSGTLVQGAESLTRGFEGGSLAIPPAPNLDFIPLVGTDIENFWQTASLNIEEALRMIEPQLRMLGEWALGFAKTAGIGILHFIFAIFIAAVLLAKSEEAGEVTLGIARRLAGTHGFRFAELASQKATAKPSTDCQKYFQREARPLGSLATTLRQSSTQPMAPKPKVTSITTQTKRLVRSAQSSTVIAIDTRISAPPIVGVPLLARCDFGPSSRTDWPILYSVSLRIIAGPTIRQMNTAVIVASTARSVR